MNETAENVEQDNYQDERVNARQGKSGHGAHKDHRDKKSDEKKEGTQLTEKLISVRRVTKVVKGGKNMRFSALIVVGDGKGRAAYASAKAREVPDAIKKASLKAKTGLIRVPLKQGKTFHYDSTYDKGASKVCLRSAKSGTGVIAGGAMRSIFEALGVQDVVAKRLGTGNSYNVVRSTFNALKMMESPRQVAKRRGIPITEINERKKVLLKGRIDKNVEQD